MSEGKSKYFCEKCKSVQLPKVILVKDGIEEQKDPSKLDVKIIRELIADDWSLVEHIKDLVDKKTLKVVKGRQLKCGHFIYYADPPAMDYSNETLSEEETSLIRNFLYSEMKGLTKEQLAQKIIYHCEKHQTLLKIYSKKKQQEKYIIQLLDDLQEKYAEQLEDEKERESFKVLFAHALDLKPTTARTVERARVKESKTIDKQQLALEKVRKMLAGTNIKTKFDKDFSKEL